MSQRLIGELIEYSWSVVRPSVVNNFKNLLLQNRLPDQSQIVCGASLGSGNKRLFAPSGSHDQDGRNAHIGNLERAWTVGVKNDCKSMSVKLRYWIVKSISRDKARPLVSRLYFEMSFT